LTLLAKPKRIASMNLCTDQYLLLLADPSTSTIVTITWLAHNQKSSYYFQRAKNIPANHGDPEEIISYQPDLIVGGLYSARISTRILTQLGYRVELFDHPTSIEQVRQQLRRIGDLIGRRAYSELIINKMNLRLKEVMSLPKKNAPTIMQYAPSGFTVGRETLVGDIMYHAGWRNSASVAGIKKTGYVDLETLIVIAPLALIDSPLAPNSFSYSEIMLKHPALLRAKRPKIRLAINPAFWNCGGPMLIDAIVQLRKVRESLNNKQQKTDL